MGKRHNPIGHYFDETEEINKKVLKKKAVKARKAGFVLCYEKRLQFDGGGFPGFYVSPYDPKYKDEDYTRLERFYGFFATEEAAYLYAIEHIRGEIERLKGHVSYLKSQIRKGKTE